MNEKSVWNIQNIIDNSNNWTLACDDELLKCLKSLSEKLFQRSESALNSLNSLQNDVTKVCISVANTDNHLKALSDTQFIESKVQDDVEIENSESRDEACNENPDDLSTEVKLKTALEIGLNVLRTEYDIITVTDSDSENDEDIPDVLLKSRNPYMNRKLPFTIGSDDFTLHDHVGIISSSDEDDEDEEIEVESKSEESLVNEYSPKQNNIEISKLTSTLDVQELSSLSNSVSSLESGSLDEKTYSNVPNTSDSMSTNVHDIINPYIDDIFSPPPFPEHETNLSDNIDDDEYESDLFSTVKPNISNSVSQNTEKRIKSGLDDHLNHENLSDNNDSTNAASKIIKEEIIPKNVSHAGVILPKTISQGVKHGMFDALNKELANKLKIPVKPNLSSTIKAYDSNEGYVTKHETAPFILNKNEKPADTPNLPVTTSESIGKNSDNSKVQKSLSTDLFDEDENIDQLFKIPTAETEISKKQKVNVNKVLTEQLEGNRLNSTDVKNTPLISISKKTETIKKKNLFDDESDSEDDIFNIIKNQKVNLNDDHNNMFNTEFTYEKSCDKPDKGKSVSFFEDTTNNDVESFSNKPAASFDYNKPKSSYLFNSDDSDDSISELLGKRKKETVVSSSDAINPENDKITSTPLFQTHSKDQSRADELQMPSQSKNDKQSAENVDGDNSLPELGNADQNLTSYNTEIVSSSSKLFGEHKSEHVLNKSDIKGSNETFDEKLLISVEAANADTFTKINKNATAENVDIQSNSGVNEGQEILNDDFLKHNDVKQQPIMLGKSLPEEKVKNIPGKLAPGRGLNINVNALLPKLKMKNTINEKVPKEQPDPPVSTQPPPNSVDSESNHTTILPNVIKDRAKITSKRRPQTRSSRMKKASENDVFSNKNSELPIDSNRQDLEKQISIDEQTKDIDLDVGKSTPLLSNSNESPVKYAPSEDIFEAGIGAFNVATNLGNDLISASGSREPPPSDLNLLSDDDDDDFFGNKFNQEYNSDNFNEVSKIRHEQSLDAPQSIPAPTAIHIERAEVQNVNEQAPFVIVNDETKLKTHEMCADELKPNKNSSFSTLDNPSNEPVVKPITNMDESSQKNKSIKESKFKIDDIFGSDSDDDIFSNKPKKSDEKLLKERTDNSAKNITLSNTKKKDEGSTTASNSVVKNDKVDNLFGEDDDDDLFKKPMKKHFIQGVSRISKNIFDNDEDDDDDDDLFGGKAKK